MKTTYKRKIEKKKQTLRTTRKILKKKQKPQVPQNQKVTQSRRTIVPKPPSKSQKKQKRPQKLTRESNFTFKD